MSSPQAMPSSGNQPQFNVAKYIKFFGYAICAIVFLWLAINSWTVTPAGQTKVQTCFGNVTDQPFKEGLHFPVNPLCQFDIYDTREFKYEVSNINIPTQDRFNSSGNVTAIIRVPAEATPTIKSNYGNMTAFLDKTVRQYLRAQVRDEGRKLRDSRSLAMSDKVSAMQASLKSRLAVSLKGKLEVIEVLVQDITFDERIANQILRTQERIQKEEAENSQLRIAETIAKQKVATANGEAESSKLRYAAEKQRLIDQADGTAYALKQDAEAKRYSVEQAAEAERYSLEQQAVGNEKLTASLTPEIMRLKELEVKQIEAGNGWNGQLPANFSPIYGSNGKDSAYAPFILKTVK